MHVYYLFGLEVSMTCEGEDTDNINIQWFHGCFSLTLLRLRSQGDALQCEEGANNPSLPSLQDVCGVGIDAGRWTGTVGAWVRYRIWDQWARQQWGSARHRVPFQATTRFEITTHEIAEIKL